MKNKEELNALKEEGVELTDEELAQVSGGFARDNKKISNNKY